MFIIAAVLASTTPMTLEWDHVYASGDTRRIRPVATKVVKKKDNGLAEIIARVKQENGLAPKPKKAKLTLRLIP